jgi:2-polyprenyl-3-methyl-5-hydroxy-6-metoxy-1,4-benzoquinol methylase
MQSRTSLGLELLSIATSFRPAALVQAAVELDLFTRIRHRKVSFQNLATELETDPLALKLIFQGLQAIGFLNKDSHGYSLAAALEPLYALSVLQPGGEVTANQTENKVWLNMASILKKQQAAPDKYRLVLLQGNITKYRGIRSMNAALGCSVLRQIESEISKAKRILDIGGGDGILSDLILSTYPRVRVDVLELPEGAAPCQLLQQQKPESDLRLVLADARTFETGDQYDVIIINELLELFPIDDKTAIVRQAVRALSPNGCLLITKFDLDSSGLRPCSAAIFSVRMRLKSEASYLETNQQVIDLLIANGLGWVETHCIDGIKTTFKAMRSPPLPASDGDSRFNTHTLSTLISAHPMDQNHLRLWQELMAITTAYRIPAILFAALELNIVDSIAAEGSTIEQIKQNLCSDDVGIELIVKALTSVGVFSFDSGHYSVTPEIRDLLGSSDSSMTAEILQYKQENKIWLDLASLIKESSGVKESTRRTLETDHINHYLSNVSAANQASTTLIGEKLRQLALDPHNFIDIGAGNGDFTIQLCIDFPDARGTILDLPHVIDHHRTRESGYGDWVQRVEFQTADITNLEPSPGFDLAVISDLLHYFPRSLKIKIVQNAIALLQPDGALMLHKFSLNAEGTEPLSAALLSLKFNLKREGAYLETDQEAIDILKECGLKMVEISTFDHGKTLIIATKS